MKKFFLSFLKKKDVKLAVCTNKMEKLSLMLLEKLEVLTYFDYLVGGDTFKKSKPDPMPLFEICNHWKHPKTKKKITELMSKLPVNSIRGIKVIWKNVIINHA